MGKTTEKFLEDPTQDLQSFAPWGKVPPALTQELAAVVDREMAEIGD